MDPLQCVNCGKQSEPTAVWLPGWGCLYGMLAVCGEECARKFVEGLGNVWRDGDLSIDPEEADLGGTRADN